MGSGGTLGRGRAGRILATGAAAGLLTTAAVMMGAPAGAAAGTGTGEAPGADPATGVTALGAGTATVSYRGYTFKVPGNWPVIRLARHPRTCVRFDRHAVYLGTPAADQACPAAALGSTEALLIQPARRAGGARAADNPVARRITVTTPRVTVTASYSTGSPGRARIQAILASASLPPPRVRQPARPRFGPALLGAWASSYTGLAFDACTAPSSQAMRAWRAYSPFGGIGIYIGGQDRACDQPNLTAAWVSQQAAAGWRFIPLYVGPQLIFHEITAPRRQAASAARDAVTQAMLLGLGPGTPIYYDMEAYRPRDAAKALAFFTTWTQVLHSEGYRAGIYSGPASGVGDLAANFGNPAVAMPDIIYDAWWNGAADTADPVIPAGAWAGHRRIHQYMGGAPSRFGGIRINIDHDYMDVQLGSSGRPGWVRGHWVRGHWARARGGLRFAQLAARNGVSWQQLHDPALPRDYRLTTRYLGRKVPKGTRWWVPGHMRMATANMGRSTPVSGESGGGPGE